MCATFAAAHAERIKRKHRTEEQLSFAAITSALHLAATLASRQKTEAAFMAAEINSWI